MAALVPHGHTVPGRPGHRRLEHGDAFREIFSRIATNARICLACGARGIGVAGAMMTGDGVRVAIDLA